MWQKLKEQLPAIALTIGVIGGGAYWLHTRTVSEMGQRQQTELAALRDQTNAEIKAAAEENRRQIDAVNTLLKDAIQKRSADMFMTDEEVAKINAEKVNQLAEAIATKIQPYNPLPKSAEEAEQQQNAQVDKVSARMAERIQPILSQMASDQNLTRESINQYSQKITDQVSVVLTTELAKNQTLNNNLVETQAVARDSLALSHELTALYLSSLKDQGVLTRVLSLPANVIKDVAQLSIVSSSERKKKEEELVGKLAEIQKRLTVIQAQAPGAAPVAPETPASTQTTMK